MDSLWIFTTYTVAIVLEATPFLLAGALLSALMEHFLSPERVQALAPKSLPLQLALGACAGLIIPTCECGVVPIVRRLIAKGAPPSVAITYMLTAPVINPVVLLSTWVAFRGDASVVLLRVIMILAPALVMGAMASRIPVERLLRSNSSTKGCSCCHHDHDHHHEHTHEHTQKTSKFLDILRHTASEYAGMGVYLIVGAMAAAAFKTFAPQQLLTTLSDSPFLAIGGMMLLAIVLSICSEADAFVATSFAGMPVSSQLGFMAIGPMVDIKLIAMFLAVFHRRFTLALVVVPVIMVWICSMAVALSGLYPGGF